MSIEAGCNGVEATIVLIAAVVAFPATWRERLLAIVIDTRILSYSIPFYAALHFALGGERLWSRFFAGLFALYLLLILGLVSLAPVVVWAIQHRHHPLFRAIPGWTPESATEAGD